jgi:cell wall-associated NlpC family hydrolase
MNYANLIGVPYSRMHCWDLAKAFYKQVKGVELKHYFEEMPKDRNGMCSLIYANKGDFKRVDAPRFGDIILLRVLGVESHIAIYVDNGLILHTSEKTGSVIDRLSRWSKCVSGYYTLEEVV